MMIEIDGKFYKLDIDSLMAWVSESPASERNINTITTLSYPISDDNDDIVEKEVSETKGTLNDIMNNIRYDLIRNLLQTLFASYTNDYTENSMFGMKDLTFGQKLAFNSLLAKNIIVEI